MAKVLLLKGGSLAQVTGSDTLDTLTTLLAASGSSLTIRGQIADGGAAVGVILDNAVTLATSGAKLLSVKNNGVEEAYIDKDGGATFSGTVTAIAKSFRIPHPTRSGKHLRYGSLEGPENGVYVRGRLSGRNVIPLPDYWTKLVDPDSITVKLTPLGRYQRLYVEAIRGNEVVVGSSSWRRKIDCFYTVYAERVDVPKLVVEE